MSILVLCFESGVKLLVIATYQTLVHLTAQC